MHPLSLIQSVSNSMVKHAFSLKVPKKAKEAEDFLCEGFHLVEEGLRSALKFRFVFVTKEAQRNPEGEKIIATALREKTRCFEVTSKIISYLSDTAAPQGILGIGKKPLPSWPSEPYGTILGVHQVQDAGNMGTLFRSAEAFGAQAIFLTEGCCDPFNPKAVRASMGSLFRLPFMLGVPWESYLSWLKERQFHSYALAQNASVPMTEVKLLAPQILWVGSEGAGLPEEFLRACDERVRIPMTGGVESLNVGVAASLALFWAGFKRPVS